jgi:hypothetical protein
MMKRAETGRATRLAIVSIAALGIAFSYLIEPAWDNERAHYDFTRSLAQGTPAIDESLSHPALRTIDFTRYHGHAYAAKAPGLAAVSVPPYLVLEAAGAKTTGNPKKIIWGLHLWGVVVPALLLLALVRRHAECLQPGFGAIAAATLGAATLLLPFSTIFFAHVLSAALGFAAFAVLLYERKGAPSRALVFAGGLVAGLAFTVEYSLALVAVALGVLAVARADRLSRALMYALGVGVGALPTLAVNTWEFGTPFRLAYEGWHQAGEQPMPGFFGIHAFSLDTLLRILFSPGGVAPILLPAIVGGLLLWRRGARLEAAVPLLVAALYLASNSARSSPFGGASPGPRFLIPVLPFLAVPLAVAYRAIPGATLGLAAGGGLFMAAATLTTPQEAWDGHVAHRLFTGQYVDSVASFAGVRGAAVDAPFVLALVIAAAAAIAATPWRARLYRDVLAGALALAGWLLVSTKLHAWLASGRAGEAKLVAAAFAAAALVALVYGPRRVLPPRAPVEPSGG